MKRLNFAISLTG